jgi:hypothetical protein
MSLGRILWSFRVHANKSISSSGSGRSSSDSATFCIDLTMVSSCNHAVARADYMCQLMISSPPSLRVVNCYSLFNHCRSCSDPSDKHYHGHSRIHQSWVLAWQSHLSQNHIMCGVSICPFKINFDTKRIKIWHRNVTAVPSKAISKPPGSIHVMSGSYLRSLYFPSNLKMFAWFHAENKLCFAKECLLNTGTIFELMDNDHQYFQAHEVI